MTVDLENSIFYLRQRGEKFQGTAKQQFLQIGHFKSEVFSKRFETNLEILEPFKVII